MSKDVQNKPKSGSEGQATASPVAHTVELKFGYQDKDEKQFHKSVTFGRRSTGGDVIRAAEDSGGTNLQYFLAMVAGAITKFGELPMPVSLTWLLALDEIDREILLKSYFGFMEDSAIGEAQKIELGKARLAVGFERDGVRYDTVEFGRRLTGYDEIDIEREANSEVEQTVLKRCRRIVKISSSDDAKSVEGAMTLAEMQSLDYADFILLKEVGDEWLDSFR